MLARLEMLAPPPARAAPVERQALRAAQAPRAVAPQATRAAQPVPTVPTLVAARAAAPSPTLVRPTRRRTATRRPTTDLSFTASLILSLTDAARAVASDSLPPIAARGASLTAPLPNGARRTLRRRAPSVLPRSPTPRAPQAPS